MDQLVSMRTFARVATLSSFTRAADSLGVSRAVASTHVSELERYLGVRLFHRTTRRATLTPDGAEYLERCRRILAEVDAADEALKRTRQRPQGRLRIDVPTTFGRHLLMPALPEFTRRYPDLALEVQLDDRVVDLVREKVDVAVRVGPVLSASLVARRVCRTRILTCASPAYLAERGAPLEPEELRKHRLIGYLAGPGRRARRWIFQRDQHRRQVMLPFAVAFDSPEALVDAAVRGVGILQSMDMLVVALLASRRLELVLGQWSAEGAPISVVYPAALRSSPKVRAFADFATELLLQSRRRVDAILATG